MNLVTCVRLPSTMDRFHDRREAGRLLAQELLSYANSPDTLVLALPRGGIPVGYEVARSLAAPLDTFVVRKLGVPGREELAMGAVASGGLRFINEDVVRAYRIPDSVIEQVAARELRRIEQLERAYRGHRPPVEVRGRNVIVVDDGLATGATMHAALRALRSLGAVRLIVAVPVGARETCETMREDADVVVCLNSPHDFRAVGVWYENFGETSDDEVRQLLAAAAEPAEHVAAAEHEEAFISLPGAELAGILSLPPATRGLVIFAHGSGSGRHSPRNQYVAEELRSAGFGTLLLDLLTADEERIDRRTAQLRFDIALLARRLSGATAWAAGQRAAARLPFAYFGASTGAAAALIASLDHPQKVATIVSRGGRPDLAGDALARVSAPTLFIVGSRDEQVIELNREAAARMRARVEIEIVEGATHLFEEPGALDRVAHLAARWFERNLAIGVTAKPNLFFQ